MIALAEIEERERTMRTRRQTRELMEARHGRESNGIRERIIRFAGTAFPHRTSTGNRGATCVAC